MNLLLLSCQLDPLSGRHLLQNWKFEPEYIRPAREINDRQLKRRLEMGDQKKFL